jgi:pimeloyl-ACP methyl ester carboxylesterase
VLGNVLVGMREAITGIDADLDSLVVVGHSAGGALASDYAAISRGVGLPVPRAVLSIYPGRAFRGIRFAIPAIDPARIPAGTRLHVLSGADDGVVDPRDARAIYDGADRARRRFEIVRTPGASDHLGPQRDTAVARRVFWRRLDALIAEARRSPLR